MTDTKSDIPSVVERTRPVKADVPVVAAHFLGDTAVLVLGEEALLLAPRQGDVRSLAVHGGAILASSADADRNTRSGKESRYWFFGLMRRTASFDDNVLYNTL